VIDTDRLDENNDFIIEESEEALLEEEVHEFISHSLRNFTGLCPNSTEQKNQTDGFLAAFTSSITVILVSEIGDKTFFIAAILAMTNSKLVVFLGALSALYIMTSVSAALGLVVTTFIPREITYYTCTALMFLFGLKMIWEAWRMGGDEAEETRREVEEELGVADTSRDPDMDAEKGHLNLAFETEKDQKEKGAKDKVVGFMQKYVLAKSQKSSEDKVNTSGGEAEANDSQQETGEEKRKKKGTFIDRFIDSRCPENSGSCLKTFKLFLNCLTMTFIAEWGDRSQLATIVLAGINNVYGVIVGGCLGHTVCTGAAVLVGMIVARFISARFLTLIGALVFIGFGIASILTDPNKDGIDGIPDIPGYDNCTRLINHNISLTLELEDIFG